MAKDFRTDVDFANKVDVAGIITASTGVIVSNTSSPESGSTVGVRLGVSGNSTSAALTSDGGTIKFLTHAASANAWISGRADGGLNIYSQANTGSISTNLIINGNTTSVWVPFVILDSLTAQNGFAGSTTFSLNRQGEVLVANNLTASTGTTKLGTITVGTWNGSQIASRYLSASTISIGGTNVGLGASAPQLAPRYLTASTITIGSTGVGLGGTATTVSGLTLGSGCMWSGSLIDVTIANTSLTGTIVRVESNASSVYAYNAVLTSSSFVGDVFTTRVTRPSSSLFNFITMYASVTGDPKGRIDGTGKMYLDNGTVGTPGDYAEYFEWADGNPNDENRIGYSVIIDQDAKITFATESSKSIIGIISSIPAFAADAAWNGWKGRYLYTDLGEPIYEEQIFEDGSVQTVRKMNPEYDPSMQYVPREQRKEWDAVGLVGKLRLRKGQPINPDWIKLRDISNDVEEWLVR